MPGRFRPLHLLALWPFLSGFVLLGPQEATLPVSPEAPTVQFVWDGNAPGFDKTDEYQDGILSGLTDSEIAAKLLTDAMAVWNAVPAAFVELQLDSATTAPGMDPEDRIHTIAVAAESNLSSAASALATNDEDDPKVIRDCDIKIADRKVEAAEFAYIVAHELGHCLGLGHPHSSYRSIMSYARSDRNLALGADDKAGLIYLYPDPDKVADAPREIVCGVADPLTRQRPGLPGRFGHLWMWLLLALPALAASGAALARHEKERRPRPDLETAPLA